jgi:hypothetical protein
MLGGLLIVPLIGLAYSAFADLGAHPSASSERSSKPKASSEDAQPARRTGSLSAAANACCSALKRSRAATTDQAQAFDDAIAACEAASTPVEAKAKVATVLNAADATIPRACQ